MNEIANDAMSFASMGFMVALVIIGLIAWFFINRASVKAIQQVRLLEALLEEQKRQNMLLQSLTDSIADKEKSTSDDDGENEGKDFTRLIPER